MFIYDLFEDAQKRVVVTYPGRFQPFHKGHAEVFANLQRKFGSDNVFIVTSNKTDGGKSPFNFSDKVNFMHAMGIPDHQIIETDKVYELPPQFASIKDQVVFITVVGAPDEKRLNPGSTKKDGNPSYFQHMPSSANELHSAEEHGYVIVEPEHPENISIGGKTYDVSHGTPCRELWNQVRDNPQQRAEFVQQLYGKADAGLANILDKIPTGAPEPAPKPSPKLKAVKQPNPAADLNEFAPPGGDDGNDGFSDETLKRLAAQWWQGDEDPRVERTLAAAGWEIGQDEGYDNGGVFVVQAGDVNGNSYMSWPAEELDMLSESKEIKDLLTEAMLQEAFLDSIAQVLGNKLKAPVTQVANMAQALQVLYRTASDPKHLETMTFLLKKRLAQLIKSLPPILDKLKQLLVSMIPQGRGIGDFIKALLLVAVAKTGTAISMTLQDEAKEAFLAQFLKTVAQVPELVMSVLSSGVSALGNVLQALKIGNAVWFELLNEINAKIEWANKTFPGVGSPRPAGAVSLAKPAMAEGVVLTKDQKMDIYISGIAGKYPHTKKITKQVARDIPLSKVESYIQAVAEKHRLNPKAFVYGPSKSVAEDAAGVGVIASKKQKNDPRYSMSMTQDVGPGEDKKNMKKLHLEGNRGYNHGFASPTAPSLGRRGREDDEYHVPDPTPSTWYIRANGKIIKDKMGTPYQYRDKETARKAAMTMMAKPFNAGKKFMLTTSPEDDAPAPVAENTGPVTHRIGLTVTDPNHPMVSKRKETYQKSVRITQDVPDREAAINQAIAHYRRKGYKVHDHHYIGTVDNEPMAEGKRSDTYHIVNKDGKPVSLASYADKESAIKDRDAKHQGAEVRQLGPRGKVKGVSEGAELKQAKRKYNQAAKDANLDQVGAGKKIDTMKKSLRQKDLDNKKEIDEGATGAKPGWMLKQDPALAKKVKDSKAGHQALKKWAGKPVPKDDKQDVAEGGLGLDHKRNRFKSLDMRENAEELNIGDPVIITGKGIEFEGKTGDIDSFGDMKRFVVVNLYNYGKHSFHSSDVSSNEYVDPNEIDEDMYQYNREDPYNSEFAPRAGMGRMTLRGWKQQMIKRTAELAQQMADAGQDIDKGAIWDHVYKKLKSMNMDPIAQEIEQAQAELEKIRQRGGVRSRAFNK